MASAKILVSALTFEPANPATLPINSLYVDQNSLALSNRTNAGSLAQIGPGAAAADTLFTKFMQNSSGATIAVGTAVAKKADGSIVPAEANVPADQIVIGVMLDVTQNNAQGRVGLIGPNIAGAITGLGFAPGSPVYVAEGGGYTTNPSAVASPGDAVVRIGYADCAAGPASSTATDLIMFAETVFNI